MVCVVRVDGLRRLVPSCAFPARDGLVVHSEADDVKAARRTAVELLLGEHVGDCEGPCRLACPAHIDIPSMIRHIAAGGVEEALATVRRDIGQQAEICETCTGRCEKACRRGKVDQPVAIRLLRRYVTEAGASRVRDGTTSATVATGLEADKGRDGRVEPVQFAAGMRKLHCIIGRMTEAEHRELLKLADPGPRVTPAAGAAGGFSAAEAVAEARRCLHCDCRKSMDCRLRDTAEAVGADARRFAETERYPVELVLEHPAIVFEPGKCVKCGLCVRMTEQRGEALGLTFVRRGFATRVSAPCGESQAAAITHTAEEVVTACPTGALAWREPGSGGSQKGVTA
jgi:predicted molibdopterin-dependent oxidoreductase YjgC